MIAKFVWGPADGGYQVFPGPVPEVYLLAHPSPEFVHVYRRDIVEYDRDIREKVRLCTYDGIVTWEEAAR